MRVAVVGAGGFLGRGVARWLIEKLGREAVVPVVHTCAGVWSFAPMGIPVREADLLDRPSLAQALKDVTHVVNCARGDRRAMIQGLKNLLWACRLRHIERFVHISSTSVYGDPPPPEARTESASARPKRWSYGHVKLLQDHIVQRAGVPHVLLCPPHIVGPESRYGVRLVLAVRAGAFALVNGGQAPMVTVDRRNVARAVELALTSEHAVNKGRVFIVDKGIGSWNDVLRLLAPLTGNHCVWQVSSDRVQNALAAARPTVSIRRTIRFLLSDRFRNVLREDGLLRLLHDAAAVTTRVAGRAIRTRRKDSPSLGRTPRAAEVELAEQFVREQLRATVFSGEKAEALLGFAPEVSWRQSWTDFMQWLAPNVGLNGEYRQSGEALLTVAAAASDFARVAITDQP